MNDVIPPTRPRFFAAYTSFLYSAETSELGTGAQRRYANIVTLYESKGKGDRSDDNNFRGIHTLSIVGKAFCSSENVGAEFVSRC